MLTPSRHRVLCEFLLIAALTSMLRPASAENQSQSNDPALHVREPQALASPDGGKTILVANRRSGTISAIDTANRRVVAEHQVGRGLSDIAVCKPQNLVLVADEIANEILVIEYGDRSMHVIERFPLAPAPVRLVVFGDGSLCAVASLWSRTVTFFSIEKKAVGNAARLTRLSSLDLPFCPRELARTPDGSKLIVADAFGGRLATVDATRRSIESLRTLPAHNIRGMAFAPGGGSLVIAHQRLNQLAQSSFDDVHWGLLISNHLRVLRTSAVLRASSDSALLDAGRLYDLGDVGYAAGDPGAICYDCNGNLIVALAGMDEVAITASPEQGPRRIAVGQRPSAVTPSADGSVVYVANRLGDSVSVVEIKSGSSLATISLGARPEPKGADRGERLFYSAKLSHDGWMSCHSCHSDGHTNSLVSDTLGDGSFGSPKRVPSLLGVAATGPWTWTGSMARLDDQVRKSIATTMHGPKLPDADVADLVAYMRTLTPPASQAKRAWPDHSAATTRGRAIFESRKCADCHIAPEYTSSGRYDVGLADEVGNREFNPPSLQGVGVRDSYLHDARARSLDDVFLKEKHPRGLTLSAQEVGDLVSFLKSL